MGVMPHTYIHGVTRPFCTCATFFAQVQNLAQVLSFCTSFAQLLHNEKHYKFVMFVERELNGPSPTIPSNCRREQQSTRYVPLKFRVGVLPHSLLYTKLKLCSRYCSPVDPGQATMHDGAAARFSATPEVSPTCRKWC